MYFISFVLWTVVNLLTISFSKQFQPQLRDITVSTTNGPITGHPAPNRSQVHEFLGIPFAEPPTGVLRFAAPQAYRGFGPSVASDWTHIAPYTFPWLTPQAQRIINYFTGDAGTTQDEDCLTLNIWTKNLEGYDVNHPKQVLIFFYGGRGSIGNTNNPFYNGQYLSDAEDVIVVTVNYRLNIFGFPNTPHGPQNLGLRDQRLAVEWFRDNAASFGGDPKKLTIFGQSFGGVAVDYWSYAYKDDPIVAGLPTGATSRYSLDVIPWKKAWRAYVQNHGGTLNRRPGLSESGEFAKLPYLLGNTNNEQGYYILPALAQGANVSKNDKDQFLLQSFTCPNSLQAMNRRNQGVPTWLFRYFGDWYNLRLFNDSGAYHGADIEMIFGNDGVVSGIPPSTAERRTTTLMQRAWAVFADDPVQGLSTRLGWPLYDPDGPSLIRLAFNNNFVPDFVSPQLYDGKCSTVRLGGISVAEQQQQH
ncbi:MAG: hypothetical protein M1820_002437 [Bogoriella megaspora]|nr:MAG: hypothetical protein M1820_002437 [Bogoriella megaspora]